MRRPAARAGPSLPGRSRASRTQPRGCAGAALLARPALRDEAIAELSGASPARAAADAPPRSPPSWRSSSATPSSPSALARDQLGLSRRTLGWSYPDAWPGSSHGAARAAGVDPTLLRAVMRRESGFRTDARSPAGAIGLLQIIPGTAARLAALLGLPAPLAERLEEPAVNVPLGAGYLSLLLERFGEPLVAIAAYNAGPAAVLRWGPRPGQALPLDAWVESIPFRETRQYVRAVVENWAGARAASGEPPLEIDPEPAVPDAGPWRRILGSSTASRPALARIARSIPSPKFRITAGVTPGIRPSASRPPGPPGDLDQLLLAEHLERRPSPAPPRAAPARSRARGGSPARPRRGRARPSAAASPPDRRPARAAAPPAIRRTPHAPPRSVPFASSSPSSSPRSRSRKCVSSAA